MIHTITPHFLCYVAKMNALETSPITLLMDKLLCRLIRIGKSACGRRGYEYCSRKKGLVTRLSGWHGFFVGLSFIRRSTWKTCAYACGLGFVAISARGQMQGWADSSKWDKSLPSMVFDNVHVNVQTLQLTLRQIGTDYLLRTVLYQSSAIRNKAAVFTFDRERTTGKELLDAVVSTFTNYQYTQDEATGVILGIPKSPQL